MKIRSKFWLEDEAGDPVFGEGRQRILELIDELGSMQATAKALGMSYRGVWARIKTTEERLGVKLVETSVGRGKNRGSRLTPKAKKLLDDFRLLNEKGMARADELFSAVFQGRAPEDELLVPVVAVVGPAGAGKTELVGRLTEAWAGRGIKIGVIGSAKIKANREYGRLLAAGAPCVIQAAPSALTVHFPDDGGLNAETIAANYALGCDLVLVESRERLHLPTIELYKKDLGPSLLTRKKKHLLAVTGDRFKDAGRPHFDLKDLAGLMDLVEKTVLAGRYEAGRVQLMVDGRKVPMLPFVRDIIKNAVAGMVASLKTCDNPRDIEIRILGLGEE